MFGLNINIKYKLKGTLSLTHFLQTALVICKFPLRIAVWLFSSVRMPPSLGQQTIVLLSSILIGWSGFVTEESQHGLTTSYKQQASDKQEIPGWWLLSWDSFADFHQIFDSPAKKSTTALNNLHIVFKFKVKCRSLEDV